MSVNCIDNVVGGENISNYFINKYSELYNSVGYEKQDMQTPVYHMNNLVSKQCNSKNCNFKHSFCVRDVCLAVQLLKHNKSDGNNQLSDGIINGCHRLFVYLNMLYNLMLKHGYAPEDMLMSTVVPIPKNKKKSLNDSNNYRGIALSSIIGKVLELLILNSNRDIFRSCDL